MSRCFTPNSKLELLFDESILTDIPQLAPELHIRPLSKTDYIRDHLKLLAGLTCAPDIGLKNYENIFQLLYNINQIKPNKPTYSIICLIRKSDDQIIATGTLLLEQKFIRNGGSVGHIEDIVVDQTVRGQNLGKIIIKSLLQLSQHLGAYKTILDCNKDNITFYEKCGFEQKEYEMVKYTPHEEILTRFN